MGADRKHVFTEAEALETIARYMDLIVFIGGETELKNCALPVRFDGAYVCIEKTFEDGGSEYDFGPLMRLRVEVFSTEALAVAASEVK